MESKLHILTGLRILKVIKVHDYVQLVFEKNIGLSIYNDYALAGYDDIGLIKGSKIERIEERSDVIALYFFNDKYLRIDLQEEAYHGGPEALQLDVLGSPSVIWN